MKDRESIEKLIVRELETRQSECDIERLKRKIERLESEKEAAHQAKAMHYQNHLDAEKNIEETRVKLKEVRYNSKNLTELDAKCRRLENDSKYELECFRSAQAEYSRITKQLKQSREQLTKMLTEST